MNGENCKGFEEALPADGASWLRQSLPVAKSNYDQLGDQELLVLWPSPWPSSDGQGKILQNERTPRNRIPGRS